MSSALFDVHAIDLCHRNIAGSIGSWAVEGPGGWVVIESGPASTWEALEEGLSQLGVRASNVSALLLTHIHLDHAGGAWRFAELNVPIHVHRVGAPHMIDPTRLERSARRVYGDRYDTLWGAMKPCSDNLVHATTDGDVVEAGGLQFQAIETLGHANHHHAWHILGSGDLFTGDAVGMRVPDTDWITVPMPPPEFDPLVWNTTIDRIEAGPWTTFHLTHGGTVTDTESHLTQLRRSLSSQFDWIAQSQDNADRWGAYSSLLRTSANQYDVSDALFRDHASPARLDMNLSGVDRFLAKKQAQTSK